MTWRVRWSFAGLTGESPIAPAWSASGRLYEPWRSSRSIALEWVPMGDSGPLDVAALVADGHHPGTGYLEVLCGDRVLMGGPWLSAEYGPVGHPVRGTIADAGDVDTALIPASAGEVFRLDPDGLGGAIRSLISSILAGRPNTITHDDWADAARKAVGEVYPVVIGAPGDATHPGSPALVVDTTASAPRVMIAGHPVEASTVTMWGPRAVTDRWRLMGEDYTVVSAGTASLRVTIRRSGAVITAIKSTPIGAVLISDVFDEWASDLNSEPLFSAVATATSTTTEALVPVLRIVGNAPGVRYAVSMEIVESLVDAQITVSHPSAPEDTPAIGSQAGVAVHHDADGNGATYAYVECADLTDIMIDDETQPWVSWTDGEAMPGGAGDVLHLLSSLADGPTDHDAFAALTPALNRWRLAAYIDEQVSPLQLMRSAVLPILPVTIVSGERGRYPEIWPWVDSSEPEVVLEAGRNGWAREAGPAVSYVDGAAMPGASLRYGWDPSTSTYTATADASTSPVISAAVTSGRRRSGGTAAETRWVWDQATAEALSTLWARLASGSVRRIRYQCPADTYGIGGTMELRLAQAVGLVDRAISVGVNSPALAVVGELEQRDGTLSVALYLRDDPIAD